MDLVLTNPPADLLGQQHAILTGTAKHYEVRDYAGPLSIKAVLNGRARWHAGGREFQVTPGAALIIADGDRYSMSIDSEMPVQTFCVFFRRGFVEDAFRVSRTPSEALLDGPADTSKWEFAPEFYPPGNVVFSLLQRLRVGGAGIVEAAAAVAGLRRLPAARASTRAEILRRLLRGREYMEACWSSEIRLADVARAAGMSVFHFHRAFTAGFGETPHLFLQRRRLEHARGMLARTETPVTDIALGCGWSTPSAFATAFRQTCGVSPSEFRKISKAPVPAAD